MALSVAAGTFTASTGGSTTTVSTAFQPLAIIMWSHLKTGTGESSGARFLWAISSGGTIDTSVSAGSAWAGDDAVATTNVGRDWRNAAAGAIVTDGSPTTERTIRGIAFNATPNFVVTFNGTPTNAYLFYYIIFGGDSITNVYVGNANMITSSGPQSITAPGFQGDIAFFVSSNQTTTGGNASSHLSLGCLTASHQWATTGYVRDAQATTPSGKSLLMNDHFIVGRTTAFAADYSATGAFTSTGIDLTYDDYPAATNNFALLVIKGGYYDCGVSTKPATATTQTVSGLSFVPKLLGMMLTSATANNTATSYEITTFGATDGTNQVYAGASHNDALNTVAISSGNTTALLRELGATAEATFSNFGSDGSAAVSWGASGTAYLTPWFAAGDTASGASKIGPFPTHIRV